MHVPAMRAATTAASLCGSRTMPMIPKIRAMGNESSISGPPRAARGLRQPGRRTIMQTIIAPAITRNVAAIFP